MHLSPLLEVAGGAMGDRIGVGPAASGITYGSLLASAGRAATLFGERDATSVVLIDGNSAAIPIALFGAAIAGVPYVPLNYRLADDRLRSLLERCAPAAVVVDPSIPGRLGEIDGISYLTRPAFLARVEDEGITAAPVPTGDPDAMAVLLYTSGTTGDPKATVLRHANLVSYVLSTVEFMGSDARDAAIVSVPAYHIAGISAVLTSVYGGRRIVYLESFDPASWIGLVRDERVTHAMVVPTMLTRILQLVDQDDHGLPTLRSVSYGGGRMPLPVIERAMALRPDIDWVNAYGLTETSSTVAVLGPDDHRTAFASDHPAARARLTSVGRPLPSIELEIRDDAGSPLPAGCRGEIHVRGAQVAGEYLERRATDDDGWFPTNDAGHLDEEGFLFVHGRLDDVIVRGAENISPGEIEDVLVAHRSIADAAVVGVPDVEWGERIVAAVVAARGHEVTEDELQRWVRDRLRSSRTPERISLVAELPYNETGKLLRRVVRATLLQPGPD